MGRGKVEVEGRKMRKRGVCREAREGGSPGQLHSDSEVLPLMPNHNRPLSTSDATANSIPMMMNKATSRSQTLQEHLWGTFPPATPLYPATGS